MKKPLYLIAITFILIFSLTACNKDKEANLLIEVYPSEIIINAKVDTILTFTINLNSNRNLQRFIITALPSGAAQTTLLDTNVIGKNSSFRYFYKVKQSDAGKEISMIFTVYDVDGNNAATVKKIVVNNPTPIVLTETGSFTLYSLYSNKECAFDLINGNYEYIAADSSVKDIQDNTIDTLTNKNLSHNWNSPSECNFSIVNGYDYSNATDVSAKEAFNAGTKYHELHNINEGDIIIAEVTRKNANPKYVVIKITQITDIAGIKNDYYTFYLKK